MCRSDEGKGQNPPRGEAAAGAPTNSSLPGRPPLCGWWRCGFLHLQDPRLRNGGGRPPQRRPLPSPASCWGGTWVRWGDRSPGTAWSPAPMESVDRWPLASPDTQIPGGSRPAGAAVRRRVRGAGPSTRGPYAAGHTALARADWWNTLRADRCLRGYSGGNWMVTFSRPPGAPGLSRWPGARSPLPFILSYILAPSGALGRRELAPTALREVRAPGVVTKISG